MSYKQKEKTSEQNIKFWENKLNQIGTYSNLDDPNKEIEFYNATGFFSLNTDFTRSKAITYINKMIDTIKQFDKLE